MRLTRYETPHLWGRVQYEPGDRLRPDGDTLHLRDPVLLYAGRVQRPDHGQLELTLAGHQRPRLLELRGDNPHLTIRLSGLDAPEAHYVASTRPSATGPAFDLRADRHVNVCQPHFRAAASFLRRTAERARYIPDLGSVPLRLEEALLRAKGGACFVRSGSCRLPLGDTSFRAATRHTSACALQQAAAVEKPRSRFALLWTL